MIKPIVIRQKDGSKRNIGKYDEGSKTFTTYRDTKKHLLIKYNAWAIDVKVLEFLIENEATVVVESGKKTYIVSAKKFMKEGRQINFSHHRKQIALNRDEFNIS